MGLGDELASLFVHSDCFRTVVKTEVSKLSLWLCLYFSSNLISKNALLFASVCVGEDFLSGLRRRVLLDL